LKYRLKNKINNHIVHKHITYLYDNTVYEDSIRMSNYTCLKKMRAAWKTGKYKSHVYNIVNKSIYKYFVILISFILNEQRMVTEGSKSAFQIWMFSINKC